MKDRVEEKVKWPCSVVKNGICNNSVLCQSCKKWIHKWYSGVKGSLYKASQSYVCRSCKVDRQITDRVNADQNMDIDNRMSLKKVDNIFYLGVTLYADVRCDSPVMARVRFEWKKLCELELEKGSC